MGLRNQLKLLLLGKRQLSISLRPSNIKVRENSPDEFSRLVSQMSIHNIQFVYDVGANKGQFGKNLYRAGYRADSSFRSNRLVTPTTVWKQRHFDIRIGRSHLAPLSEARPGKQKSIYRVIRIQVRCLT